MQWFEVDKQGLARLLERKGKAFALFELVQNAWDEQTKTVDVQLERIPGTRRVRLTVEDDNPDGFANLAHAFTLFADSSKKTDAGKRGKFNLGEKLVLALCDEAEIASTKGAVMFTEAGRVNRRVKRERGSKFDGILKMTDEEIRHCSEAMRRLIPPAGIVTRFNGEDIPLRVPLAEFEATLPTEIADADGLLRRSQRKTVIRVFEPTEDEVTGTIYEMGIPVVETGDRWHVDIQQKVPVGFDRDNCPPSYLARVRALVLDHMQSRLSAEDANATWVRDAIQRHGGELSGETVGRIMDLRFGEKRVAFDMSDPEANHRAVAEGYQLVYGAQLSKPEWEAARRAGSILPAGQVTPSPKPFSDDPNAAPLKVLPESKWTPAIRAVSDYSARIGERLLGCSIAVTIARDVTWPFAGAYGSGRLTLNLGRLGHAWFEHGDLARINELLLHEFAHHFSMNHLDAAYHGALSMLGGKMVQLALSEPKLFVLSDGMQSAHAGVSIKTACDTAR